MDRREAMLRELNLYPLWVRREKPVQELPDEPQVAASLNVAADHKIGDDTLSVTMPRNDEAAPFAPAATAPAAEPAAEPAEPPAPLAPLVEDIFSLPADKDDRQAGADTLREFQLKSAGGVLGSVAFPELREKVKICGQCGLRAGCTQTVFGAGNEQADWLFVGEASGADEDATGEPFVGHAGRLLDNMLLAIKLKRREVYIANVIKCRPPDDRHPHVGEIAACLPYLKRQIALVQPRVIVALGRTAASALLGTDATIASLRGRVHDYQGIPLIVTFHPAYLLRSPMEKARAWQDLCLAVATLKEA